MDSLTGHIASLIGSFYLELNDGDYYSTEIEILKLRIQKIEVTADLITIFTERPGRLYGRRFSNLDQLSKYLQREVKIVEVDSSLLDYLIPYKEDYELELPPQEWDEKESPVEGEKL